MKKEDQNITLLDSDTGLNNDYIKDSYKTTNINILLNRVKLNKKNDLKKKLIILFSLLSIISVLLYSVII